MSHFWGADLNNYKATFWQLGFREGGAFFDELPPLPG
jgi:hypothetical protein